MTLILDKGLSTLEAFDFDGLRGPIPEADRSVSAFEDMQMEMSALQDKLNGLSAIMKEKDVGFEPKTSQRSSKSSRRSTSRRSSRDIVAAEREI